MELDPIVEQVHRVREVIARRFGDDLHAICEDARRRSKESGRETVSRVAARGAAPPGRFQEGELIFSSFGYAKGGRPDHIGDRGSIPALRRNAVPPGGGRPYSGEVTNPVRNFLEWAGGRRALVLAVVLVIVGGTWGFIELADVVREGRTQGFDERMILALTNPANPAEPIGPPWLGEVGRDVTALGGVTVLSLVTLSVAGYLLMAGKYRAMGLVLGATVSGLIVGSVLKGVIHRDRPHLVPHRAYVYTSSFPSGHSMMSAVVYLTLGSLLTRLARGRALKAYFLIVALFLTLIVGVSRVYMAVHYPTDVLAGWTAGLVWALLWWLAARRCNAAGPWKGTRRRGKGERGRTYCRRGDGERRPVGPAKGWRRRTRRGGAGVACPSRCGISFRNG